MADIIEAANKNGSFKKLLQAAKTAGLVETLKTSGPYTLFAPSDEAFAKLPEGTVESLMNDKTQLARVLNYHIVQGKLLTKDVMKMNSTKTMQGQTVTFNNINGVHVNESKVTTPNIEADNGVIHAIDSVLMPK